MVMAALSTSSHKLLLANTVLQQRSTDFKAAGSFKHLQQRDVDMPFLSAANDKCSSFAACTLPSNCAKRRVQGASHIAWPAPARIEALLAHTDHDPAALFVETLARRVESISLAVFQALFSQSLTFSAAPDTMWSLFSWSHACADPVALHPCRPQTPSHCESKRGPGHSGSSVYIRHVGISVL